MREKLVLALATVVVIGAIAVIAFAVAGRSNAAGAAPEVVALSGADADVIAPLTRPELVSSDSPQAGGPNDGIQVHGRWTVEVTEPDGRLVSLTEFDNSLDAQWGEQILSNFLGHVWSPGVWRIRLLGSVRPCETGSASQECEIWELPSSDFTVSNSSWRFGELSVTVPSSGPNENSLVLSGTATVANATTITDVETGVRGCAPSVAPADADCGGSILTFTSKTLSPGVPVLADQAVNVTVVISFS
ncbi:MAG: hypothetical protein QF554_07100 [Dehalococcoidia bacterium]|jgi:hypothetical protein|nr:hypothetical protein [Dehalococcoidia bacterium]